MSVVIGVDVGQKVDPTAICVAESDVRPVPIPESLAAVVEALRTLRGYGRQPESRLAAYLGVTVEEVRRARQAATSVTHANIRHLERLPLGIPYPEISRRLATVIEGVQARNGGERPRVFVDATGVGLPVVDLLRENSLGAKIIAVYFTHGDRRTKEADGVKLGKAWLVSRLQALLQSGRLHLPQTAEARALAKELLDYEIRVSEDANDRYGAFRVGTHDDLVTALGLSVQVDQRSSLPPSSLGSEHAASSPPGCTDRASP